MPKKPFELKKCLNYRESNYIIESLFVVFMGINFRGENVSRICDFCPII